MRTLQLTLMSLALGGAAFASSGYPTVVHDHLALSTFPQCTLCHTTLAGGAGTANQPFGVSVRNHGAVGGEQDAKLIAALDALAAANVDSDGDGVPDVTELKTGLNPNVKHGVDGGTPGPELPEPPRYGCGAESTPAVLGLWAALMTLAVVFRKR